MKTAFLIMAAILTTGCEEMAQTIGYRRDLAPTTERLIKTYEDLASKRFQVLADFETPQQQSLFRVEPADGTGTARISTNQARRETGVGSLKMSFSRSSQYAIAVDTPEAEWALHRDWSKYHLLIFSVYSPRTLGGFTFSVKSGTDIPLTYKHSRIMLKQGWNLVRIDLGDLSDRIDLTDVREVQFWCEVLDTPIDLYLDDIILADNSRDVFATSERQEGDLYVRTLGRRLAVGAMDRFEMIFSRGKIRQWFDLVHDPIRMHNLTGLGTLGPNPIVVPDDIKGKILIDDINQWQGLGVLVETFQTMIEATPLRVVVQGEWRFGSLDSPPSDTSPYHRWVYTIYRDGRVYIECSGVAKTDTFDITQLGMAFCCDGDQGFKLHLHEGTPSTAGQKTRSGSYALFSRSEHNQADLMITPFRLTDIRQPVNPEDPRLCVLWPSPIIDNYFIFSAMMRIWPLDIDSPAQAEPLVNDYCNPLPLSVETGQLVRTDPGDFDNDGFSESRGHYTLQLDENIAKVRIDGRQHMRFSPIFKLVNVAQRDVWIYLNGRLIKEIYRDPDGNVIFELPEIISSEALLEITSLVRENSTP